MDRFIEFLKKKDESKNIKRALTDSSYKKTFEKVNKKPMPINETNFELATLGDSILKFVLCNIYLDDVINLSKYIEKYLKDEVFIETIAKQYSLLEYLLMDDTDCRISKEYIYFFKKPKKTKYIATAIEAMIAAIYLETNDLSVVKEIIMNWISIIDLNSNNLINNKENII